MQERVVLYPGTFDPITLGHLDVIVQGCEIFDRVVVAVMKNPTKMTSMFTSQDRCDFIKRALVQYELESRVDVMQSDGMTVDLAQSINGCIGILRGLRLSSDFENELTFALNSRVLNSKFPVIWMPPFQEHIHISSTVVRSLIERRRFVECEKYVPTSVLWNI